MKRILTVALAFLFLTSMMASASAVTDTGVVKLAFTDSPMMTIGEEQYPHPSYAAMLAFKGAFESYTNNRFSVELYPYGVLGDADSNLSELLTGTLQGATPADGTLSSFCPTVQILLIPYLFKDILVAYELLDSQWFSDLCNQMAAESGLRIIAVYENGGYRNFTNNVRTVKTASDMEGLKMRVMDSTIYRIIVESLGASVTVVGFSELYSALQTGVVDGEENSAITVLNASLDEVQKYMTVDQHLLGLAMLTISEDWYQSLSEADQAAVLRAGKQATVAARGAVRTAESAAFAALAENGMEIYYPSSEELATFKAACQQPAIDWLYENFDNDLINQMLAIVDAAGTY